MQADSNRGTSYGRLTIDHIPIEIFDYILSFLELDDYNTPCNLSLVCRSWSAAVRPYVFRSVCLHDGGTIRFNELLNQIPLVRRWVRKIRIISAEYQFWSVWCSDAFVNMVQRLDNLFAVSFERTTYPVLLILVPPTDVICKRAILRKNLATFRNIHELSFPRCSMQSSEFATLVGCFPNIQTINLGLCRISSGHVSVSYEKVSFPLTSLNITSRCPSLDSIFLPEAFRSLHRLHFKVDFQNDQVSFSYIMACLGSDLRTLLLDIPYAGSINWCDPMWLRGWDTTRLIGLRELEVRIHPKDSVAAPVLRKLGSLSVHTMTLQVSFKSSSDITVQRCAALDGAFTPPAFRDLKSLRLVYKGSLTPSAALETLEKTLPTLWNRSSEVIIVPTSVHCLQSQLFCLISTISQRHMRFATVFGGLLVVAVSSAVVVPLHETYARGYDEDAIAAQNHNQLIRAVHARELVGPNARPLGDTAVLSKRVTLRRPGPGDEPPPRQPAPQEPEQEGESSHSPLVQEARQMYGHMVNNGSRPADAVNALRNHDKYKHVWSHGPR
ncbi:hypothetical protein EIP91_004761 [Steccherinum ochraceum]|uniref:F-box domain-containing protein n=1 Tax=Steccherinum ochraceum TaxID=92696 RepID=A0A4R0RNJ0_9APHY|nr:hypothetical protein EIP91_004761 [Steccherinum ochraceum]